MNKWEYSGSIRRGRTSNAAKQAYHDMREDDCTLAWMDHLGTDIKLHVIITEEMLGIELCKQ